MFVHFIRIVCPVLGVRLGAEIIEIHDIWSFASRNSESMEVEIIKIQGESALVV